MYKEPPNKRFFVVKSNSNPCLKSYVLYSTNKLSRPTCGGLQSKNIQKKCMNLDNGSKICNLRCRNIAKRMKNLT